MAIACKLPHKVTIKEDIIEVNYRRCQFCIEARASKSRIVVIFVVDQVTIRGGVNCDIQIFFKSICKKRLILI